MKALIFEGNGQKQLDHMTKNAQKHSSQKFVNVLRAINPDAICDVVVPAHKDYVYMMPEEIKKYDYVFWLGSTLNAYDKTPEVLQQIEQARLVFKSGVPFYGICWGLQMAVMASGGHVDKCVNGLEIGLAKNITLTSEGKRHPMFKGKGTEPFASFCVHFSETVKLPPQGTVVLASNKHSRVQALEIKYGGGIFWGVQYHPEINADSMVSVINRGAEEFCKHGVFANDDENSTDMVNRITEGYGDSLQDSIRLLEIKNFIEHFSK